MKNRSLGSTVGVAAWYAYKPVERDRVGALTKFLFQNSGTSTISTKRSPMGKGNNSQKNDKKKKKPKKQEIKSTNKK